ncbi:MAG: hypothetical protein HY048_00155 [Acidobacteria bacterium]|nr:hypothetical protein [Acidobacteriota bacterium]
MSQGRIKLSAVAIVTAIIAANSAALLSFAHRDAVCATMQHACDRTPSIRPCCCDPQGEDSHHNGPTESRVQVGADTSAVPVVVTAVALHEPAHNTARPHTSPPRTAPPDLPTLFARLLI